MVVVVVIGRVGWKQGLGIVAVLGLAAGVFFYPRNRVAIGTTFRDGTEHATLRLAEPCRAVLRLGTPLPAAGRAHVEIRRVDEHGEHVEREYTARAGAGNDEIYVALPHASQAVDRPGRFRVVFLLDGEELGAAELRVTE